MKMVARVRGVDLDLFDQACGDNQLKFDKERMLVYSGHIVVARLEKKPDGTYDVTTPQYQSAIVTKTIVDYTRKVVQSQAAYMGGFVDAEEETATEYIMKVSVYA
jgi:hypothetical protein